MGLLEKQLGLLPVTSNQQMLAQALKSRSKPSMSLKPVTPQGLLDNAALATSPVPFVGDAIGLAADANRFYNEPESRTPLNFGLAALGLLPFVPSGVGAVKKMTQYEKAHEVAQKNAALPVEKGGLGLPPNNTAMDRAKAMGFRDGEYHGTNKDVNEFSLDRGGEKTGNPNASLGVFTSPNASEASRYATGWGKDGANVMPLMVRDGEVYPMSFKELDNMAMLPYQKMISDPSYNPSAKVNFGDMAAQKAAAKRLAEYEKLAAEDVRKRRVELLAEGYDSAVVNKGKPMQETIAFNPANVRSRFAAFDPMRRNENNLLANVAPFGLAGLLGLSIYDAKQGD